MALLDDGSDYLAGLAEEFSDGHLVAKCSVLEAIESAAGMLRHRPTRRTTASRSCGVVPGHNELTVRPP